MTLRIPLADTLAQSVTAPALLVVTDGHVGSSLAADIGGDLDVRLVTERAAVADRTPDGVRTAVGDPTERETLAAVGDVDIAVVALRRDRQALLVAQLLRTRLGVESVVLLLNDPERHDVVEDVATTVVCASSCLSAELGAAIDRTLPDPVSSNS